MLKWTETEPGVHNVCTHVGNASLLDCETYFTLYFEVLNIYKFPIKVTSVDEAKSIAEMKMLQVATEMKNKSQGVIDMILYGVYK